MTDQPRTMLSPIDGRLLERGIRPQTISFGGKSVVVDLPGYYPVGDDEGIHTLEDLAVSDAALLRIREELAQEKAARKSLKTAKTAPKPLGNASRVDAPGGRDA